MRRSGATSKKKKKTSKKRLCGKLIVQSLSPQRVAVEVTAGA